MAIKAVATVSSPLHLQELSWDVAELEGECPKSERAWVIVRQGTEGDEMDLQQLRSGTVLHWSEDSNLPSEAREVNVVELQAMTAYKCITDVGNIFDQDDKPLFKFKPGKYYSRFDGTFSEFKESWGVLPPLVADAVLAAVLSLNPQWSGLLPEVAREQAG